jgi:hypothetical protein
LPGGLDGGEDRDGLLDLRAVPGIVPQEAGLGLLDVAAAAKVGVARERGERLADRGVGQLCLGRFHRARHGTSKMRVNSSSPHLE